MGLHNEVLSPVPFLERFAPSIAKMAPGRVKHISRTRPVMLMH